MNGRFNRSERIASALHWILGLLLFLHVSDERSVVAQSEDDFQQANRLPVLTLAGNRSDDLRDRLLKSRISWLEISKFRYLHFADGTRIDLKHFRAAMLTSQLGACVFPPTLGEPVAGIVSANLAGWLVEWNQLIRGQKSGHPFGGNEDLYSNFAGSVMGKVLQFGRNRNWNAFAIGMLEKWHGPLRQIQPEH